MMPVEIIENFIDKNEAKFVIKHFDKNLVSISDRPGFYEDLNYRTPQPFDKNLLDSHNFFETKEELIASSIINSFIYKTKKKIESFYNENFEHFVGGMTKLLPGAEQDLHADMCNLDGTEIKNDKKAKVLKYSALLYLSSTEKDFSGGHLEFPKQELVVKPKTGKLVFFKGDENHPHSVSEIFSGKRYAIVMFFG